jgi:WD40 repeat protein
VGVAFRPDGARLVSTSSDGTVRQWDTAIGREVEPPYDRHFGEVITAEYSPDGKWIASTASDWTIRIWRATGRQDLAILNGHTVLVNSLAFTADGRWLTSVGNEPGFGLQRDDTVRVWDVGPQATLPVLRGHSSYVYPVAFSPDGRWIASGGWDNTVRLWDGATGELRATLHHPGIVWCLAFSPGGSCLVTGNDGDHRLRIWDIVTARVRREFESPRGGCRFLAVSPDGLTLAATVRDAHSDSHHVSVFNLPSGECVFSAAAGQRLRNIAFSPDGRWLAFGAEEGNVVLIVDARTYQTAARFVGRGDMTRSVAFSPDSRRLATAGYDHTVRLWEIETGASRVLGSHTDFVFAVAFHPDGTRLATAGRDRAVWLWDLRRGEEVARLPGHTNYIWSLAFSPDGKSLVSGSGDFTVRLWDTEPLKVRYQARRTAAALRPAADRLVARVWEQTKDSAKVLELLRSDRRLTEPERHAAELALMRRAAGIGEMRSRDLPRPTGRNRVACTLRAAGSTSGRC